MQLPNFTKKFTYIKPENSRVFIPQELETEAYNKIAKNIDMLEQAAKIADKDIFFVPKKDNALMNFGPYSTLIDVKLQDSEIIHSLNDIIHKTYRTVK